MTFRSSLARYVRGLLEESTPTPSDPPTPSPLSSPPTTTPSTTTTTPAVSEAAAMLAAVLETMERMQRESMKETREMVISILQGRQEETAPQPAVDPQPSRQPFDPPDYDDPGTEDLPPGLQSIFERERVEQDDVRRLRTEQEVLLSQLDEARAALVDPQGTISDPSLSRD